MTNPIFTALAATTVRTGRARVRSCRCRTFGWPSRARQLCQLPREIRSLIRVEKIFGCPYEEALIIQTESHACFVHFGRTGIDLPQLNEKNLRFVFTESTMAPKQLSDTWTRGDPY